MLVLTRKVGEQVVVGNAVITIVKIRGRDAVRIGIDAPIEIPIVRGELLTKDKNSGPKKT